jgi:pimeloyl-ACP methyl ester carboxylesterase
LLHCFSYAVNDETEYPVLTGASRLVATEVCAGGGPYRWDLIDTIRLVSLNCKSSCSRATAVSHSYGGNVISKAATGNEQVQALVFFNGWMCDEGESQQQLLEQFEGSLVGPSIRPVPFTNPDGSEGIDLFLDPAAFPEAFAADVDPETAAVMAAAQRPYTATAFAAAPSDQPSWKTLPCWYLLGTEDKAIPPALQRFMAERANATIVEVPASHVSFVSQPEAATQLILQAVEAISAARP